MKRTIRWMVPGFLQRAMKRRSPARERSYMLASEKLSQRRDMRRIVTPIVMGLLFAASLAGSGALAGDRPVAADAGDAAAPQAAPACLEAEVNPVTRHALCVNPLGAAVEPPPAAAELPCEPDQRGAAPFTFKPNCKPRPSPSS
jgi:hypothetical protein